MRIRFAHIAIIVLAIICLSALCIALPISKNLCLPTYAQAQTTEQQATTASNNQDNIFDKLEQLFNPQKHNTTNINEKVYLGGYPLGITLDGDGVRVIGLNEFVDIDGKVVCPALDSGIRINDIIIELDGKPITSSAQLAQIARDNVDGDKLTVKYTRQGKVTESVIYPKKEFTSQQYKLGLWTRDGSSGVGTLTYIRQNLQFGSLGHPIYDTDGKIVDVKQGGVYLCNINGVVKGQKGKAGELKGSFDFADKVGSIYINNKFGVFGNFSRLPDYQPMELIDVASIEQVKVGKAYVYCTLDGTTRDFYEIEIVKAVNQQTMDDKGMVIRVTDSRLLEKTGGIVQGMSGSPIVQNGKLVGAVTHVFVNDPTRGYGIYAQWMLQN